jgi:chromosome segregation ATPase
MASYDSKSHLLAQIQDIRENRDKVVDEYQKTRNRAEKAEKAEKAAATQLQDIRGNRDRVVGELVLTHDRADKAEKAVKHWQDRCEWLEVSALDIAIGRCNAKDEEIAALKANLARVEQNYKDLFAADFSKCHQPANNE